MRYICEGNDLYKNDANKTWVAWFKYAEDCQAIADSLNAAEPTAEAEEVYEELSELSELEPALC